MEVISTAPNLISYDPQKYSEYQSLESGHILKIEDGIIPKVLLETHQAVWSPTPFAINLGEVIASDSCQNKVVMDFATGSGYLAIIAGKQGARKVVATDLNPTAIQMTKRNWELNNLNTEQLDAMVSDRFEAMKNNTNIEEKFDFIYSNPPTIPELGQKTNKNSGIDWNIDGESGRKTLDTLIIEGRNFLKPGGEMLIATSSKQGAKLTCELLDEYWGRGIKADSEDPLDYALDWEKRGNAKWAVIKRKAVPFPYYVEFLDKFRELAKEKHQPAPFIEKEGTLYQKLYLIRAKKDDPF
jgi:release factor glutamine methyltransferase